MARKASPRGGGRTPRVKCRGRVLSKTEIAQVQRVVRCSGQAGRLRVCTLLCRAWNWRRPNGALSLRACGDLLVRLEENGTIRPLPPRKHRRRSTREARASPGVVAHPGPLGRSEVDLRSVVVRPIKRSERAQWRDWMGRFHYLGDGALIGENLRYVAECEAGWLALLGWGGAARKSRHREAFIGWNERVKCQRLHLVANNSRFLILPWVQVPHLASLVLAANLRRLSGDWESSYSHPILLAETFVDLDRFRGTCYRAANWTYLGQTRGVERRGRGYRSHGQPKGLFVYPVHPRAREILSATLPRREMFGNSARGCAMLVDVNRLPLEGEGGLIELMERIEDPRHARGKRHRLSAVLSLAGMAVLSGMRSYEAIAEYARDLPRELLKKLGCGSCRAPSEGTFRRVLQSVDAEEMDRKIGAWVWEQVSGTPDIAIDGKTLRGSSDGDNKACHLFSAITHGPRGVVVGQKRVDKKSNEISAQRPLLNDLNLEGRVVTADALHTQTEFARYLVDTKHADYLFEVKDNQPKLRKAIEALDWGSFPPSGPDHGSTSRPDRGANDLGQR